MADHDGPEPMQAEIDHHLMATFCRTLDSSAVPPMTVMRMMASALGAIYRQSSATHHAQECLAAGSHRHLMSTFCWRKLKPLPAARPFLTFRTCRSSAEHK